MTHKEHEESLREISRKYKEARASAIERYNATVARASKTLKNTIAIEKFNRDRDILELPPVERNHMSHARQTAFAFMRHMKRQIFDFRADEKEFVYECGQIAARVDQHFDIGEETVKFTITVEMQLKERNNQ